MKLNDSINCCDCCNDGDGHCVYPYYGLAPRKHDLSKTGSILGSTVIDNKSEWPEHFAEDWEAKGCGTYAHCLECNRPNKPFDGK